MSGAGEGRVMHAMSIDDAYRVDRTLRTGAGGVTEVVTLNGSGPFLRKKMPLSLANRKAWAALAECSCPRLPRVAATYETPDEFAVVYDYIPGDTLAQVVAARGRLAAQEAVRIVREVCEAVGDLHAHGVVHCDISPENIVIAADGAHLLDFGIARMLGQGFSDDAAPLGTWGFAAPEQFGFARVDERTDVFAVACILGYLLTGLRPDEGPYEDALADTNAVPASMHAAVKQGSAFEPSARFASVAALAEAADCAAKGDRGAGAPSAGCGDGRISARDGEEAGRKAKRERRLITFGICAAVVVAVCGAVAGLQVVSWITSEGIAGFMQGPQADRDADAQEKAPAEAGSTNESAGAGSGSSGGILPSGGEANVAAPVDGEAPMLSLVESCWFIDSGGFIRYAFGIRNNSDDSFVDFPQVSIVGRDEDGRVLSSDEHVLFRINPGQTLYFGSIAGNGSVPCSVEFSAKEPQEMSIGPAQGRWATFRTLDVSAVPDGFGGSNFVGEVALEEGDYSEYFMGQVAVTVILRDGGGTMVSGYTGFADAPQLDDPVTFEVFGGNIPDYESLEVCVQEW